jgi:hypothetical protein
VVALPLLLGAASALAAPAWPATVPAGWLLAGTLVLSAALLLLAWRLRQRMPHSSWDVIDTAPWPALTVLVQARAQDAGLSACLQALVSAAYPARLLRIVPICEPGDAQSRAIVKAYAHLFPDRVFSRRCEGDDERVASTFQEALLLAQGDLLVTVDTRECPPTGLLKQLVRPFFDPEVGVVLCAPPPAVQHHSAADRRDAQNGSAQAPVLGALRLSAIQAVGGCSGDLLPDLEEMRQRLRAAGWMCVLSPRTGSASRPGQGRQPAPRRPVTAAAVGPLAGADPLRRTLPLQARAAPRLVELT